MGWSSSEGCSRIWIILSLDCALDQLALRFFRIWIFLVMVFFFFEIRIIFNSDQFRSVAHNLIQIILKFHSHNFLFISIVIINYMFI